MNDANSNWTKTRRSSFAEEKPKSNTRLSSNSSLNEKEPMHTNRLNKANKETDSSQMQSRLHDQSVSVYSNISSQASLPIDTNNYGSNNSNCTIDSIQTPIKTKSNLTFFSNSKLSDQATFSSNTSVSILRF